MLTDFGTAASSSSGIFEGRRVTVNYIAPDVLRDDTYCNKVDDFSAGISAREISTGFARHSAACANLPASTRGMLLCQTVDSIEAFLASQAS